MKTVAEFLLVLALGVGLIAIGTHYFAPQEAEQRALLPHQEGNIDFQRTIFAITATIILLIPTYWTFILQNRSGASTLWRVLWTVSWLAFVVHLYWAIRVVMTFDDHGLPPPETEAGVSVSWSDVPGILRRIYPQSELVSSPTLDILVFLWWTLDLLISWVPGINGLGHDPPVAFGEEQRIEPTPTDGMGFIRLQREALHGVLAIVMVVASVPQGHGVVRFFGALFALSTVTALAVRIVRRPFVPESLSGRLYTGGFGLLNRFFLWYQLPTWLAVLNLGALREVLRANNLHGMEKIPVTNPAGEIVEPSPGFQPADLHRRRGDGWFNDLEEPAMGSGSRTSDPSQDPMLHTQSSRYSRFGRNVPLEAGGTDLENLMRPSPRLVSEKLLARKEMIEAPTLNLLAAAWIQFQTHDWFAHGEPDNHDPHRVPLPPGDGWINPATGKSEMLVRATRPDPTRPERVPPDGQPRTFVNAETHWWDASQIYGSSPNQERQFRSSPDGKLVPHGRMYLDESGQLPYDLGNPKGIALSGFVGNWWAGLSLLHDVFVKEHNAICDRLHAANPDWDGDHIFATAKMINGALMAKIHTVEWTRALLQHPALQIGMNANWWGLATEGITKHLGRLSPTEAFGGIPNSGVDHHGTPFTLTQEFVTVYRMHPLLPDVLKIRTLDDASASHECRTGIDAVGTELELRSRILTHGRANIWYSFGLQNPGALTLHNYPEFLRLLTRESAGETDPASGERRINRETLDLATVDILRDRERGVPRYNEFRRQLHQSQVSSFEAFRESPYHQNLPEELREVYGQTNGQDNVHLLDTMVGMFAETPPTGFAISDTAFRIFILMASRRLKSDRFIAESFNADVFTKEGVDWVNDNSMVSVICRHFPELTGPLYGVGNAFIPWRDVKAPTTGQPSHSVA